MYKKYVKRLADIVCALAALSVFCWLYAIVALLVRINLGSPIIFKQPRPGKDEKIFYLYKFRTMTDKRDANGNLLPDSERLTKFGKFIRATSLDELPEAINILKGDMSVVGPRPLLVRDMVFMTPEQRKRHTVSRGLTGLARVSGRNGITWEQKLSYDLEYIEKISFFKDVKIVLLTVWSAFVKHDGISQEGMDTAEDLGNWLLDNGVVDKEVYDAKVKEANELINV